MTPPDWETILHEPFVSLILGQRGAGKTALGHRLLEVFGQQEDRDAYILGFPRHLEDRLPDWIEVLPPTTGRDEWPADSVVLVHEAHQLLHARRSMDSANVEIDELVTVSRHRNSDIIFETQQSQRLDRNSVTAVDAIIVREPALMQAQFERKQLRPIIQEAEEMFDQYTETVSGDSYTYRETSTEVKRHAYIHSSRFVGEYPFEIELTGYWSEDISKAYAEVEGEPSAGPTLEDDERNRLIELATWENENRPLSHKHLGADHDYFGSAQPWHRLRKLIAKDLAEKTYDSNSSTYYRLTEAGWDMVEVEKTDEPMFN